MASDKKTNVTASANLALVPGRVNFQTLILSNPNYFGTFPNLGGVVIEPKSFDTEFEQLTCLGLNPQQSRLEAVVNIKQHSGYDTDACGGGSLEYVRFFVQQGAAWVDLGSTSFNVYNLASTPLPLSYSTSVDFNQARKLCTTENILNVRAILSWNLEPPAGNPNFNPPWGNVVNARVQVAPFLFYEVPIGSLVAEGLIKLNAEALSEIDVTKRLPSNPPAPLSFAELKKTYEGTNVPAARFGFVDALKVLEEPLLQAVPLSGSTSPVTAGPPVNPAAAAPIPQLAAGKELGAILAAIAEPSGNTTYEELLCAGFNPQTRELEGVIEIKLNAGYSGGLCAAGSTEFVSFFAFISGAWQALGTATVNVHDLAAVTPGNPLMYAVYRISNFTEMLCQDLTGVPLRAILSWQTAPTGPDFIPFWGNVINTNVQPTIADTEKGNQIRLMRIGDVSIDFINDTDYLAYPSTVAGDCSGFQSPFGGEIIVEGDFIPKPDVFDPVTGLVLPGAKPIIYQVWVTRTDIPSAPFQLTNSFGIEIFPPAALNPVNLTQQTQLAPGPVSGGVATAQYYQYMESDLQAVNDNTLAAFEAGGLTEGDYQIEVRGWVFDGTNYVPLISQDKTIHVFNGYPHTEFVNTGSTLVPFTAYRPQLAISLTSVPDCASAPVGTVITGNYSVTDEFFGSLTIELVPITIDGSPAFENPVVITPDPGFGTSFDGTSASSTTGSHGTFTLNTANMAPCGYTILLQSNDRALVDSHCYHHWNWLGVGFCLTPPSENS